MPILKTVQESEKQVKLSALQDIKNTTNETLKPATKLLQPSTYPTNKDEWDGATSLMVATSKVDVGLNHLPLKNKKVRT